MVLSVLERARPREPQIDRRALHALEQVYSKGDTTAAEALFAAEYVEHDPARASAAHGPEGVRQFIASYWQAFPDLQLSIEQQAVEGDTVLIRWYGQATHLGPLFDMPASGRHVSVRGTTVIRFAHDQAVEGWSNWTVPELALASAAAQSITWRGCNG